VRNCQIVQGSW